MVEKFARPNVTKVVASKFEHKLKLKDVEIYLNSNYILFFMWENLSFLSYEKRSRKDFCYKLLNLELPGHFTEHDRATFL